MNRTGKSNAEKGPDEDFNAYSDFTQHETEAHIIARWIAFTGMKDMESIISFVNLLYSNLNQILLKSYIEENTPCKSLLLYVIYDCYK